MSAKGVVRHGVRGIGVLALSLGLARDAAAQAPVSFNPPLNVSNTPGSASDHAAAAYDGATLYVAWRQDVAGGQQIRLRRSTTAGVSFADAPSGRVAVALDPAETVYAVRIAASGTYELFFVASDGNGGACSSSVTVLVPHDQGKRRQN